MKQPSASAEVSLTIYLMRRVLPVALGVAAAVGLTIYLLANSQIRDNIRQQLDQANLRGIEVLDTRIENVANQLHHLAANDIMVNGLIDIGGREGYLPAFFNTLHLAAAPDAQLSLTDYRGRLVVSNIIDGPDMGTEPAWLSTVIGENRIWRQLTPTGLTIVVPVRVNELPEGALHFMLPAPQLERLLSQRDLFEEHMVVATDGTIYASSDKALGDVGQRFTAPDPEQWFATSGELRSLDGLRLVTALASGQALAGLEWVLNFLIVVLAVMVMMAAWAVVLSAAAARKQIANLSSLISRIHSADDTTERVTVSGPLEIRRLGDDFNRMLESLERTSVTRDYLDSIVSSSIYGIITIDSTGRITGINPAVERIFAYTQAELEGRDVSLLLPSNEREAHKDYVARSDLHGQRIISRTRELRGRCKDGRLFPMELSVSSVQVRGQRGFVGILRDISDRKQTEQALAESEARLRRIIDTSSAGFGYIDWQTKKYTHVNQSLCDLLGYEMDELLGLRSLDLMHPDSDAFFRQQVQSIPSTESRVYEVTMVRRDGKPVRVRLNARTIFDDTGEPVGAFAFYTDLTDLYETQRQLEQARLEAEEATRAKSAFLANMSHEIRTPMNGVIGMLELLRATPLSTDQIHYVDTAIRSADMQMGVINDVLDYSKIEADKLELEHTRFDPNTVIEEIATLMSASAGAKNLELTCFCDPNLPAALLGDPTRLRQILVNLVGNAIKFTDRGEVNIVGDLVHAEGDRVEVQFSVRDTGVGISDAAIERLFKPFSQADSSTTRKFGGTGLGLMISKSLIEAMGGEINVSSTLDKETIFWFRIPFTVAERSDVALHGGLEKRRILVVDDNATNLEILTTYLTTWKIDVECSSSSRQGMEMIQRASHEGKPHDLLLLDYKMDDLDGIAMARAVTEEKGAAKPGIVLLSSAQLPPAEELRAAGINAWIGKPITRGRLLDAMSGALSGHVQGSESTARATDIDTPMIGRILLVEDTYINQQVALGMIGRWGIQVDIANNGVEALEKSGHADYDLILMDVQMPEMDGFEATERLRRREAKSGSRRVPIIAMTAHSLQGDRQRCLQAGMDDYLAKPFRPEKLHQALCRWLPLDDQSAAALPSDTTPSADDAEALLDMEQVDALRESLSVLPGAFHDVIGNFLEEMPKLMATLSDSVESQNLKGILSTSHNLKSNSAMIGANEFSSQAKLIEDKAKAETLDGVREDVGALEMLFGPMEKAVRRLID